jgi:hypothetical protein
VRARALAQLIAAQPAVVTFGDAGMDETLDAMRSEMRRFATTEVQARARPTSAAPHIVLR